MNYNYITNINSPNYWPGGNTIQSITIHWWGDPRNNPTAEGVVSWLCNPASQVSAHIVATGTGRRVWQLVADRNRAWHAGTQANASSIGLELDPRCRDEDYDVAAEVIANLWRYYGKLPLIPHNKWVGTQCPGNYDLARLEREANAKLNPAPKPAPKPAVKETHRQTFNPVRKFAFNKAAKLRNVLDDSPVKGHRDYAKGEEIDIAQLLTLSNSKKYYRTIYSSTNEVGTGFRQEDLTEVVTIPQAEPLKQPVKYIAKLDKVEVWDLNTHPNYKSTKTLKKGEEFVAFALIKFNGMSYYVTEYSFGKGWKHGVNSKDLIEMPKETQPPVTSPPEEPAVPVETDPPTESPEETQPPVETPPDDTKGEEIPAEGAETDSRISALEAVEVMNQQTEEFMKQNEFEPVISERVKTVTYFVTDIGALLSTFVLTLLALFGVMDGNLAIYINAAIIALMSGIKQTFRLSSKKSE